MPNGSSDRRRRRRILDASANRTDAELASEIVALTRLTENDVRRITADVNVAKLKELVDLVRTTTVSNETKARRLKTVGGLAKAAVFLMKELL